MTSEEDRLHKAVLNFEKAGNAITAAIRRNGGFLKPEEMQLTTDHEEAGEELKAARQAAEIKHK
ncbi:MAG: hypothetical protein JWR16_3458 [Nevskia sp.]|nr:hypothetical protein [Nevskia sp.]